MLKTIATVVNYTCKSFIKLTPGRTSFKTFLLVPHYFVVVVHVAKMFSEAIFFPLHIKKCSVKLLGEVWFQGLRLAQDLPGDCPLFSPSDDRYAKTQNKMSLVCTKRIKEILCTCQNCG